jgi:hypothetical protein
MLGHARLMKIRRKVLAGLLISTATALALPVVPVPEWQPFAAQVRRVVTALEITGAPLDGAERSALDGALALADPVDASEKVQAILDKHALFSVEINPEMRVKVARGDAEPELLEGGWRTYLVKVRNDAGATGELHVTSPEAQRLFNSPQSDIQDRWLSADLMTAQPLQKTLGGLALEYRVLQLYSRDAGRREAKIAFDIGQGTQDLGLRNESDVLFHCTPALPVKLHVLDEDGSPTTASLIVTDTRGRVLPAPAKRLAPDFFFHPQVYRADGETLRLPPGQYHVKFQRGPESLLEERDAEVGAGGADWRFQVKRWIDPSKLGWWSGDHHIHAAGCAHYTKPTEGVHAADMMRHVLGEDLKVGANLTWGPCFDYQKQFFRGVDDPVSAWPYLLHYDVEVSGFGSHESGHLCLLRLREQIYPGGDSDLHWPKLGLNTLKWAKRQGALVGPAHSGWGLEMDSTELPNFKVPPFNGIGANEYIVDVTHEIPGPDGKPVPAVDFISTVDTPFPWELNIWYHTLNAGFRTRISGETDFPCIYSDRVGLGRSYVQLPGKLSYADWCEGIRAGRNYVSDGFSHLLNFTANSTRMGVDGSELRLAGPQKVKFAVQVAAHLDPEPRENIKRRKFTDHPYWHLERARLDGSRKVPVELIRDGFPIARTEIEADGSMRDLAFDQEITRSGWYAVRILPSSHTNPIFVVVNDKPIRSSRRSLEWCLKGVDQCWSQKERFMKGEEIAQAKTAYDHAREVYRARLAECDAN